jgi:hypothetical protein
MSADGSRKQQVVKNTFGCGCVSWLGTEPTLLWNFEGTYATDVSTRKTRTILPNRFAGSPVGQSPDGATIAIGSWFTPQIWIVSSSGRRMGQVKVPPGWRHSQAQVFLS